MGGGTRLKVFVDKARSNYLTMLLATGSGAFLLGIAAPLVSAWAIQADQPPRSFDRLLLPLAVAPGLEAFPSATSNEKFCHLDPALSQTLTEEESHSPLFQSASLGQVSLTLGQARVQDLAVAPWPNLHPQARQARVPILMYHDVLEKSEVFFDLQPEDFERHLKTLLENGLTPISPDQLVHHLRTGLPLPEKPVLLSFDDGYAGHYTHVYPLLKKYRVPAVFFVFPGKLDGKVVGRSTLSWEQLKTMAADPLITIASHSVTHPTDLRTLDDQALAYEVTESKQRLEEELGIPIRYFSYPTGYYDQRVSQAVAKAGYLAAFTMRQNAEQFAGASESLLAIERFGQSSLEGLLHQAWGGETITATDTLPIAMQRLSSTGDRGFDFHTPVTVEKHDFDDQALTLIQGGRPVTIHADSRDQLPAILEGTNAIGAVDGGFFSLEYLNSNVMIGPVLSQSTRRFIPGNPSENPRLSGRPLVLISPSRVQFIPFHPVHHNTLAGLHRVLPGVTDAFVAAAWLVKDGQPQPASSFGSLFDFDAKRHRAFWGINQAGQPVVGVSHTMVDSVTLGQLLHQAGLQQAVMLDSGASTSLTYAGESLVGYEPRPVPHVVALVPPEANDNSACPLVMDQSKLKPE
jgi:biofilm PGA synthesis lipoprotein PgaB